MHVHVYGHTCAMAHTHGSEKRTYRSHLFPLSCVISGMKLRVPGLVAHLPAEFIQPSLFIPVVNEQLHDATLKDHLVFYLCSDTTQ